MCDIPTSIIFWALSLVPAGTFHYIIMGLAAASLTIYVANRQSPSHKLGQVEDAIKVTEEVLKRAQANCARDHVELMDGARRLLE